MFALIWIFIFLPFQFCLFNFAFSIFLVCVPLELFFKFNKLHSDLIVSSDSLLCWFEQFCIMMLSFYKPGSGCEFGCGLWDSQVLLTDRYDCWVLIKITGITLARNKGSILFCRLNRNKNQFTCISDQGLWFSSPFEARKLTQWHKYGVK